MSRRTQRPVSLAGFILLASLVRIDWCSAALPSKLHSSSVIYLFKHTELSSFKTPQRITTLDEYQVDEYVDLDSNRSSVSLQNVNSGLHEIYYNQLAPSEKPGERKFLAYNRLRNSCRSLSVNDWPLALLRRTAIDLNVEVADSSQLYADTAIGASGLLLAIESNLDTFKYRGITFSKSRLSDVEVYGTTIVHNTAAGYEYVSIFVHVINRTKNKPDLNDPMRKLYAEPGDSNKVSVVLVGACQAMSEVQKKGINLHYDKVRHAKSNLQLEEDNFCERYQTLFVVHFGVVAAYRPGTLIGKSLEDLADTRYDFHREPFVLPTGIGCWSSLQADLSWEKSLTRNNPIRQLSAEYVSSMGVSRLSFVAYDRERGLFRLDRNGRKSVYDLWRGKSFHVGEFRAPHEVISAESQKEPTAGAADTLQRCIALDITSSSQVVPQSGEVIKQVLGLVGGSDDEHYLGARVIDHVNYEVFETEIKHVDRIPVVLQLSKLRFNKEQQNKRLFVTYYAQRNGEMSGQLVGEAPLLLSYMELWELDTELRHRRNLNRIQFTEFSWQLDVEPANDPAGQRSDNLNVRLFEMEPCYEDRMGQSELVVEFLREEKVQLNDRLLRNLHQHRHTIGESIHRLLADSLRVSRLNLIDMKLKVLDSGNLLSSMRAADLLVGVSDMQLLGHTTIIDDHILSVYHNRHSLEECQLESVASLDQNWLAFCPQRSVCILLERDAGLKRHLSRGEAPKEDPDACQVYSFKYNSAPNLAGRRALEQADLIFWAHSNHFIEIKFYDDDQTLNRSSDNATSSYEAVGRIRGLKELDTVGSQLRNEAKLLPGMRYTTTAEEPGARNFNARVPVPKKTRMGAFRYCQLACQMDDLCASFSVCLREGKANQEGESDDDCVLAAVRLSSERMQELIAAPHRSRRADSFEVKVTSETHSQVLMMRKDESCSLHARDFVADFEVVDTFIKPDNGEEEGEKAKRQLQRRYMSLDDCASLSYEHNLNLEPILTNFTYCPLESNCILPGDEASKQLDQLKGYCYLHSRLSTQPYERAHLTYMSIIARTGKQISDDESIVPRKISPIEEAARMEEGQLVRKFWANNAQACARECNLHLSKCLAYNACWQADKVLCMLFSVRSVLVKQSAYLPELEVERKILRQMGHNIFLASDTTCTHFYLKPDYFEVRLNHLLQLERSGVSAKTYRFDQNQERDKLIDVFEKGIVEEDRRASNEQLDRYETVLKNKALNEPAAQNQNRLFNFSALMFGLILGAVASMYRDQISNGLATGYYWYRARAARDDPVQSSRLVVDNPFDT